MEKSINILSNNDNGKVSIEAVIESIYKLNGTDIQELIGNELIITEKDCSLIELDIIIDISSAE